MVAPLLEVLLLRLLRRRTADPAAPPPNRLVSASRPADTLGVVPAHASVLLQRAGSAAVVVPAGSLVWPPLLAGTAAAYVVLTHEPVEVWLRTGPFETLEGRPLHQVELRLTVTLGDAPSGVRDLLEADGGARGPSEADGPDPLDGLGDRLLERLAREVSGRTTDAVRRRTLRELADLSLGVVLDEALPTTFLGGALTRSALEVVDVDWPTEGRGRPRALAPVPADASAPGGDGVRGPQQ